MMDDPAQPVARTEAPPARRLRIGLLSPPWLPVPPPAYGGTEAAVDVLARGLQAMGHDVVLFAPEGSTCPVSRRSSGPAAARHRLGMASIEAAAVANGLVALADCDVIHDHTLLGPLFAAARNRCEPPMITTAHGPLDGENAALYRAVATRAALIAISRRQAARSPVPVHAVIHHGIDVASTPFGVGDGGYLAFVGRMAPEKGVVRAISIARRAGLPLRIAAKRSDPTERRYADTLVRPLLGDGVEDLGELSGPDKLALLRGATALLNPIAWHEPFGMVMIEALACGTPVLAAPLGSAPEIVRHGHNGFLCTTDDEFVDALAALGSLSRLACRLDASQRFSMQRLALDHDVAYRRLLERQAPAPAGHARNGRARELPSLR